MIRAVSTVVVGDKIFRPGQVVTGLSPTDREWMKRTGYIAETVERKKNPVMEAADAGRKDDKNEIQGGLPG